MLTPGYQPNAGFQESQMENGFEAIEQSDDDEWHERETI